MQLTPTILRELREQARLPINHWLRAAVVLALLVVAGIVFYSSAYGQTVGVASGMPPMNRGNWATIRQGLTASSHDLGVMLFASFNLLIATCLTIVVPLLVADSLSREKRDGTLGLLLLTPLSLFSVVAGKVVAHGLIASIMVLSVVPLLAIPLLLGGLDPRDFFVAVSLHLIVLLMGLSTGIFASALSRRRGMAYGLALVFNLVLVLGGVVSHHDYVEGLESRYAQKRLPTLAPGWFAPRPYERAARLPSKILFHAGAPENYAYFLRSPRGYSPDPPWQHLWTDYPPGLARSWLFMLGGAVVGASVLLLLIVNLCSLLVGRQVRPVPVHPWIQSLIDSTTSAVRPDLLKRWSTWKLEQNPAGWLESRSWQNRLVRWIWLAGFILLATVLLSDGSTYTVVDFGPQVLSRSLAIAIVVTSISSFQRDRETGALELLLVTGLAPRTVVKGRLQELFGQVIPAFLFTLWVCHLFSDLRRYREDQYGFAKLMAELAWAGGLLPIGLYCGLRFKRAAVAVGACILLGLVIPWSVAEAMKGMGRPEISDYTDDSMRLSRISLISTWGCVLWQWVLAGGCIVQSIRRLEQREFPHT